MPDLTDVPDNSRSEEEASGILRYKYLIVGGGTAAYAAIKAIREADPDAEVSHLNGEFIVRCLNAS